MLLNIIATILLGLFDVAVGIAIGAGLYDMTTRRGHVEGTEVAVLAFFVGGFFAILIGILAIWM